MNSMNDSMQAVIGFVMAVVILIVPNVALVSFLIWRGDRKDRKYHEQFEREQNEIMMLRKLEQ